MAVYQRQSSKEYQLGHKKELSEEEGGITASWDGWQQLFGAFHGMRQSRVGESRWGCHSQGLVAGGQGVPQSHVGL